jgi:hypothetical protein
LSDVNLDVLPLVGGCEVLGECKLLIKSAISLGDSRCRASSVFSVSFDNDINGLSKTSDWSLVLVLVGDSGSDSDLTVDSWEELLPVIDIGPFVDANNDVVERSIMINVESSQLAEDAGIALTPDWYPDVAWELEVNGHVKLFLASPVEVLSSGNLRGDEDVQCVLPLTGYWYVPCTRSTHNTIGVNSECSEGISAHSSPVLIVAKNLEVNPIRYMGAT